MSKPSGDDQVRIKVVGVGGAGGNAVLRMAASRIDGVEFLVVNTDAQALKRIKSVPTLAIGPGTTKGMGAGGNPEAGRKAAKESQRQISKLLEGANMVFITAGMGGGTGTGAAPVVAETARKNGALAVGFVTRPFSFEGSGRSAAADLGIDQLRRKLDTLIVVENQRLLAALDGKVTLENGFRVADEVLHQGVQGVSELVTVPGLINVDFADVKAVMADGGPAFMAMGEGKGRNAAAQAAQMALSNPLFNAPLQGARGILLNIKGGKDLTLGQVQELADTIREAATCDSHVVFGVIQDRRWTKRVTITLVATGLASALPADPQDPPRAGGEAAPRAGDEAAPAEPSVITHQPEGNGHERAPVSATEKIL